MSSHVKFMFCFTVAFMALPRIEAAYSQVISVDDYLKDPTLIKMRRVASLSPSILPELIKRYQSSDLLKVKVNCLKAINASVMQTPESKKFVRSIAADRSAHRLILEHAKLGVWLNDDNRKMSNLSKQDFVYRNQVFKIGQRLEYLLDQSDAKNGNLDLFLLFNDLSRSFSMEIGELFDRSLQNRVNQWLSLDRNPTDDATSKVGKELDQLLFEFRKENVARKILSQALRSQEKVRHLGDRSIRSKIIRACLNRLESKSISQTDFGWLKAMADPTLVDSDSIALLVYMDSLRGWLRQEHHSTDYPYDGEPTVELFAENLFLDLAPNYLNVSVDTVRAFETRMVARKCLEWIAKSDSSQLRARCAIVVVRWTPFVGQSLV